MASFLSQGGLKITRAFVRLESAFQLQLKKELYKRFPGCVILKNDPNNIQGFPDLTILYKGRYALLEVKASKNAKRQPNQEYYVEVHNSEAFAAFVYPENVEGVLNDLQLAFETGR